MCTVNKGDHPITIEWYLNGKSLSDSSNGVTIVDLGRKRSVLKIDLVDAEHTGKYTCKASNWAGSAYFTTELLINGTKRGDDSFALWFYFTLFCFRRIQFVLVWLFFLNYFH